MCLVDYLDQCEATCIQKTISANQQSANTDPTSDTRSQEQRGQKNTEKRSWLVRHLSQEMLKETETISQARRPFRRVHQKLGTSTMAAGRHSAWSSSGCTGTSNGREEGSKPKQRSNERGTERDG